MCSESEHSYGWRRWRAGRGPPRCSTALRITCRLGQRAFWIVRGDKQLATPRFWANETGVPSAKYPDSAHQTYHLRHSAHRCFMSPTRNGYH
jgi:hypothetical protein